MVRKNKIKRKSNQNSHRSSEKQKRKLPEEQTHSPNKRRISERYNLRSSNSVIFVGEIPCCRTPEQQKKYTKLGLNSALFLNSSSPPKRKQSHISIITVSSEDEVTSEEFTSEWVKNLNENHNQSEENEHLDAINNHQKTDEDGEEDEQLNTTQNQCEENKLLNVTESDQQDEESRHVGGSENHQHSERDETYVTQSFQSSKEAESLGCNANLVKEQTFHPMCSSTPNTSVSFHTTLHCQTDKWNNPIQSDPCTLNLAENTGYDKQDDTNKSHDACLVGASQESKSYFQDQLRTAKISTFVPPSPSTSTYIYPSMHLQNESRISASQSLDPRSRYIGSCNNSTKNNDKNMPSNFYFGSLSGQNVTNPLVSPFESFLHDSMNQPNTSGTFKLPSAISSEQQRRNEVATTNRNIEKESDNSNPVNVLQD
ncbi:putative uncharacterized protein DDB_G0279653 [Macrosteles quadrilineatus]|uniref:putative uncharacterized protein DDB_G0279653 n=1 Tax=Macrosteles quadrilineatus TaxID=74068 RepID=UPI0023E2952C|nr:putative uncharacterized protein DDB_G0279653 [Macrosteles quadrilineatus]